MRPKGRGRLDALELEDGPKRRWPGTPEVKEPLAPASPPETKKDSKRRQRRAGGIRAVRQR